MLPYPFSYFASIFTPRQMFANRKKLGIVQQIFTSLFLISLPLLPLSIQTSQLTSYPLEHFVEGIFEPLTDQDVNNLAQAVRLSEGQLLSQEIQMDAWRQIGQKTGFHYDFGTDYLTVTKDGEPLLQVSYEGWEESSLSSRENLTQAISLSWYTANKAPIVLAIITVSATILASNFLFVLLGASFFLFLTRKSRLFQLTSWKECSNLSLNCLGLPTLLSCLVGLTGQAVTTVLTVQNILFVLVLIWVFFKTKFRDTH